jgi:MFS family permease
MKNQRKIDETKNLRWWVITLIALATVINYIDRQTLSVLWPFMGKEIWPNKSAAELKAIYGIISIVFLFSYAFGQALFGKIFDWIGTRLGFFLSIGGIISIPLIAYLAIFFSWKAIFVIVGLTGLLWLIRWLILVKAPPKDHPWITA